MEKDNCGQEKKDVKEKQDNITQGIQRGKRQ